MPVVAPAAKKLPAGLKLTVDLAPLAAFFIGLNVFDIFIATGALIVATLMSVVITYWQIRRVPVMLLITAGFVLVFGGLTLYLHNEDYVKLKVTIIYLLFAGALLGGLAFGKSFLGYFFEEAFKLDAEGWRVLTLRWGLFFLAMAGANEVMRTFFDTHTWGLFKVPGTPILTFVFALTQVPLISKHTIEDVSAKEG
ncbi:MAG: septation protein IspZ [Ancalomicrobiaceae bacterium]|nr:septation protein IspZ [Ancalomicrobiaceae bacterium]